MCDVKVVILCLTVALRTPVGRLVSSGHADGRTILDDEVVLDAGLRGEREPDLLASRPPSLSSRQDLTRHVAV